MRVGCSGFPVGRARYFREFDVVELNSTFYKLPRLSTAEKWRAEAPAGFDYVVKAWQVLTHPSDSPTYRKLGRPVPDRVKARYGHFRPTEEVRRAWDDTARVALAVRAKAVLFQTPASFYPNADHLRSMYDLFKSIPRHGLKLVWEPRGTWDDAVVRRVCKDLGLDTACDPLLRSSLAGHCPYLRLHGRIEGRRLVYAHAYSEEELDRLTKVVDDRPGFLFFNNKSMWYDARRFKSRLEGLAGRRPSRVGR